MSRRELSDGALAELLLLRCKIPLSEVIGFIEARNDVRSLEDFAPISTDPETMRETVPSRGRTVRIGEAYVEEAAE